MNRKNIKLSKIEIIVMIIGLPLVILMIPVLFQGMSIGESAACFGNQWIPALGLNLLYWLGNMYINYKLRVKFPHIKQNKLRIVLNVLYGTIYTLGVNFLTSQLLFYFGEKYNNQELTSYDPNYGLTLFITAFVITIYEAIYYIQKWKESIAEAERLQKENTEAQLEVLKNQVHPHFLFNSLNTLISLIPENQERAIAFTHHLSQMYRLLLDSKNKTVISLAEEMDLLNNYIFLIRTRFEEGVHFSISISQEDEQKFIVPLSLQMLIENAIKHNIISEKKPLHIEITTKENWLIVRNNVQPRHTQEVASGTGLSNIRDRFKLTFNETIEVNSNADYFEVVLPLISIATQ